MEKVIINPLTEYLIVSLKHTDRKDKYITLWRPDNAGYCWPLELAGNYKGYQHGYHNKDGSVPIPKTDIPTKFIVKDDRGRDCIIKNRSSIQFIKNYSLQ